MSNEQLRRHKYQDRTISVVLNTKLTTREVSLRLAPLSQEIRGAINMDLYRPVERLTRMVD
jgi:hypothetical protein